MDEWMDVSLASWLGGWMGRLIEGRTHRLTGSERKHLIPVFDSFSFEATTSPLDGFISSTKQPEMSLRILLALCPNPVSCKSSQGE